MKCEECRKQCQKLTEVEGGNVTNGTGLFWICDACLGLHLIPRNDGSFCLETGRVAA